MGKLLLEACLELMSTDLLEGIQDMGAAGLTSSSVEMAGRAENGIEIDLDAVPRRAKKMTPYEILLSESQERMLLVAKKGCENAVLELCKKWDLDAAIIGRVTDTKRWVVTATPGYDPLDGPPPKGEKKVAADIPVGVLTDEAPVYDRPRKAGPPAADVAVPESTDPAADLLALLASPNIGSRAWIWRQYDHIVRGGTVVRPGSDAGVVRVPCERDGKTLMKHLAFAVDCNGRFVELAPEEGAKMAIAEVCRNLVCAGAEPIGITDCLNFASPEDPATMDVFARAIDGLAEACRVLDVPIVSGNVSLYNETTRRRRPASHPADARRRRGRPRRRRDGHPHAVLPSRGRRRRPARRQDDGRAVAGSAAASTRPRRRVASAARRRASISRPSESSSASCSSSRARTSSRAPTTCRTAASPSRSPSAARPRRTARSWAPTSRSPRRARAPRRWPRRSSARPRADPRVRAEGPSRRRDEARARAPGCRRAQLGHTTDIGAEATLRIAMLSGPKFERKCAELRVARESCLERIVGAS